MVYFFDIEYDIYIDLIISDARENPSLHHPAPNALPRVSAIPARGGGQPYLHAASVHPQEHVLQDPQGRMSVRRLVKLAIIRRSHPLRTSASMMMEEGTIITINTTS